MPSRLRCVHATVLAVSSLFCYPLLCSCYDEDQHMHGCALPPSFCHHRYCQWHRSQRLAQQEDIEGDQHIHDSPLNTNQHCRLMLLHHAILMQSSTAHLPSIGCTDMMCSTWCFRLGFLPSCQSSSERSRLTLVIRDIKQEIIHRSTRDARSYYHHCHFALFLLSPCARPCVSDFPFHRGVCARLNSTPAQCDSARVLAISLIVSIHTRGLTHPSIDCRGLPIAHPALSLPRRSKTTTNHRKQQENSTLCTSILPCCN